MFEKRVQCVTAPSVVSFKSLSENSRRYGDINFVVGSSLQKMCIPVAPPCMRNPLYDMIQGVDTQLWLHTANSAKPSMQGVHALLTAKQFKCYVSDFQACSMQQPH